MGCYEGPGPDINVLYQWWGTTTFSSTVGLGGIFSALNLGPWNGNPLYQLSDFVLFYPQFGQAQQGVLAANVNNGGTGFNVNDTVNLLQEDASGCTLVITNVASGVVTAFNITQPGTGYDVETGLATSVISSSAGTGLIVDVTAITPSNLNYIPPPVLQAYIAFASSCLSSQRWGASWTIAMALFVAHYATLYLQAIGNPNGTASALAAAGLAGGIIVSQSAGDVSQSTIAPPGLEDAGAWALTSFGQQLYTMAKVVGMGMIYAW
jgi:uncharacterized protein DUF4054